jgi:hypothetical protein
MIQHSLFNLFWSTWACALLLHKPPALAGGR